MRGWSGQALFTLARSPGSSKDPDLIRSIDPDATARARPPQTRLATNPALRRPQESGSYPYSPAGPNHSVHARAGARSPHLAQYRDPGLRPADRRRIPGIVPAPRRSCQRIGRAAEPAATRSGIAPHERQPRRNRPAQTVSAVPAGRSPVSPGHVEPHADPGPEARRRRSSRLPIAPAARAPRPAARARRLPARKPRRALRLASDRDHLRLATGALPARPAALEHEIARRDGGPGLSRGARRLAARRRAHRSAARRFRRHDDSARYSRGPDLHHAVPPVPGARIPPAGPPPGAGQTGRAMQGVDRRGRLRL